MTNSLSDEKERTKRALLFFFSLGYSKKQIASVMDMSISSVTRMIDRSKKKVAIFKEMADAQVEHSMYKTATGYTRTEEFTDKEGNTRTVEKYYPPQVQAQQFWLKNRKPQEWRDTRHYEFKKTLERLGDTELLEVAKEMGIEIGTIEAHEVPPVMASYTKSEEEIDGDKPNKMDAVEKEGYIPTDEQVQDSVSERQGNEGLATGEDSDDSGDRNMVGKRKKRDRIS